MDKPGSVKAVAVLKKTGIVISADAQAEIAMRILSGSQSIPEIARHLHCCDKTVERLLEDFKRRSTFFSSVSKVSCSLNDRISSNKFERILFPDDSAMNAHRSEINDVFNFCPVQRSAAWSDAQSHSQTLCENCEEPSGNPLSNASVMAHTISPPPSHPPPPSPPLQAAPSLPSLRDALSAQRGGEGPVLPPILLPAPWLSASAGLGGRPACGAVGGFTLLRPVALRPVLTRAVV
jgi:hypothetical protein